MSLMGIETLPVISTKAGWPCGWALRRLWFSQAPHFSLDQSLSRMGLEYVDIFITIALIPLPPEETMGV